MMTDMTTLSAIEEMLPAERQEQFSAVANRLKGVPADDEQLQMLEAMGAMILLMKEIPDQLGKLLAETAKALTEDQVERLGTQFSEILANSLDTPSYNDLRTITQSMRETYEKGQRETDKVLRGLGRVEVAMKKFGRCLPNVATSFAGGSIAIVLGTIVAYFLVPLLFKPKPIIIPKQLRPYAELHRDGQLDYFDKNLPTYADGEIRVLMIKGNVIEAYKEGDGSVVVIRKPARPERQLPEVSSDVSR